MNWTKRGILMSLMLVASIAAADTSASSIPVSVDCSKGQSLNGTLSKLDKHTPFTVSVNGTCTEYVHVVGFTNLTLKGLPGATLVQPTSGARPFDSVLFRQGMNLSPQADGLDVTKSRAMLWE